MKLVVDNVDVLHGIAIPDMFRDGDEEVVLDTSKKGEFSFWCANFCGRDHEKMQGKIIVK